MDVLKAIQQLISGRSTIQSLTCWSGESEGLSSHRLHPSSNPSWRDLAAIAGSLGVEHRTGGEQAAPHGAKEDAPALAHSCLPAQQGWIRDRYFPSQIQDPCSLCYLRGSPLVTLTQGRPWCTGLWGGAQCDLLWGHHLESVTPTPQPLPADICRLEGQAWPGSQADFLVTVLIHTTRTKLSVALRLDPKALP